MAVLLEVFQGDQALSPVSEALVLLRASVEQAEVRVMFVAVSSSSIFIKIKTSLILVG